MLDLPLSEIPLVFLDTETTGLAPRFGDRMVEIALARFRGDVMENFFTTLLNPERTISPGAARIHGITNSAVADAPPFREVAHQVRAELEGAVLVAHNAPFDLGFIANELYLARVSPPTNLVLDTLILLRRFFSFRSNALSKVADALGIDREVSHRALADVLTTRAVFDYIMTELRPHSLGELLHMQGGTIVLADRELREELPLPLRSKRRSAAAVNCFSAMWTNGATRPSAGSVPWMCARKRNISTSAPFATCATPNGAFDWTVS